MTPVQPMDVTCSCGRQFRVPTPQAGIRVNVPCPCGAVASAPIRRGVGSTPPKDACPQCGGRGLSIGPKFRGCIRCLHTWDDTAQAQEAKPEPAPPEPEKVIDGSVIGYRAWRIKDWALTGTGVNRAWKPGVNEATCDTGDVINNATWAYSLGSAHGSHPAPALGCHYGSHPAPALGCHCGITALARFAKTDTHWDNADVHGAIEAWSDEDGDSEHGRFILHGTGFRAQYGKVVLLAVDDEWPAAKKAAVRALAAEHGADVCKRSHLEDAAKEHGQLVPDELLEWAKESDCEEASGYLSQLARTLASQWQIPTSMLMPSYSSSLWSISTARPTVTLGRKGIKQTLGYPGPPQGRLTSYRKGDRVRDKKGQVWQCVKGGKPGRWEQESSDD